MIYSLNKVPWPGFEPGLLRPQRNVLTTIRSRPDTSVPMFVFKTSVNRSEHNFLIYTIFYKNKSLISQKVKTIRGWHSQKIKDTSLCS